MAGLSKNGLHWKLTYYGKAYWTDFVFPGSLTLTCNVNIHHPYVIFMTIVSINGIKIWTLKLFQRTQWPCKSFQRIDRDVIFVRQLSRIDYEKNSFKWLSISQGII